MIYWVKNDKGDINYHKVLYCAKQTAENYISSSKFLVIEAYEEANPGDGGSLKYFLVLNLNYKWEKCEAKDFTRIMEQLYTAELLLPEAREKYVKGKYYG
jgi:hypothetical protein